jgi:hypothetical protein
MEHRAFHDKPGALYHPEIDRPHRNGERTRYGTALQCEKSKGAGPRCPHTATVSASSVKSAALSSGADSKKRAGRGIAKSQSNAEFTNHLKAEALCVKTGG